MRPDPGPNGPLLRTRRSLVERLESEPPGATVFREGRDLGVTPLEDSLETGLLPACAVRASSLHTPLEKLPPSGFRTAP